MYNWEMITARHELNTLKKEAIPLLELVTSDIHLESIWLSTMALLENIAAHYIQSNITEATPKEELENIREHIKDEQRHANSLIQMRPSLIYPDPKYYALEKEWQEIAHEFIMAFFNSAELRKANNRHTAYVHGAQTIERFPFRIYTLYLKMTTLADVKKYLPEIIADEFGHIELGQKMYAKLSKEERMPLTNLYSLEETLCLMLLKRMNISLRTKWGLYSPITPSILESKVMASSQFEIAWNYSLSFAEKNFSVQRALYLKSANTLARAKMREQLGYRHLENQLVHIISEYVLTALEAGLTQIDIQNRFNKYYQNSIYHTNNIALHYAYYCILNEDKENLNIDSYHEEFENNLWNNLIYNILQLDVHENCLHLSGA